MLVSLHFFFLGVSVGDPKKGKALILVELLVNEICAHFTVSLFSSFLGKRCVPKEFFLHAWFHLCCFLQFVIQLWLLDWNQVGFGTNLFFLVT